MVAMIGWVIAMASVLVLTVNQFLPTNEVFTRATKAGIYVIGLGVFLGSMVIAMTSFALDQKWSELVIFGSLTTAFVFIFPALHWAEGIAIRRSQK